jgi:MerR family transcriptional regulator, light-induced transcriptional regulator
MSVPPQTPDSPGPLVRIGELSRRTGVATDTLRAWERRYDLLRPSRSDGGFRLYGHGDEERVRAMKLLIDSGVAASEAARQALATEPESPRPRGPLTDPVGRLRSALERFDEAEANSILDDGLATLTVDAVVDRIVLPAMREIGERWERGEITVAQEHFATGIVRARLLALARNWGAGGGPLALLACPPGERHDLGLLAFGVVLRERGWRVTYLGPDTPIETIARTAADLGPSVVVLAALTPEPLHACAAEITGLARDFRVLIGGAAAGGVSASLGAELLDPDPVAAALQLSGA